MDKDTFIFTKDDAFARDMEVLFHFEETLAKLDLNDEVHDRRPLSFAGFSEFKWDFGP